MRGSWRLNKDCSILTFPAPPDIAVCHSRSPRLLRENMRTCHWDMFLFQHLLINWSPTNWSDLQTQSGVLRAPSAGWWLSLPHLVSNSSDLQLIDFLSSPSYIIVQSPTHYLPMTGHRDVSLPVSLEWYVWLSLNGNNCHAVHRSLSSGASVWLYHGFLPCPILSAKPAYVISSYNCHRNVSPPSDASLWNGMLAGWKVNMKQYHISLVGKVFANDPGDGGRVIQKTQKQYLIPPCLKICIIRYGSRFWWSNPDKGAASQYTSM